MRLLTCIAVEATAWGGAVAGVVLATSTAWQSLAGPPAQVARVEVVGAPMAASVGATVPAAINLTPQAVTPDSPPPIAPPPLAPSPLAPPAPLGSPVAESPTIFPDADAALLRPLREASVVRVRANRGGTSLSLRLDFADGSRAAFKPTQIHPHSQPRREIAAFRLDRLLGLGRVPPAAPRVFELADLVAAIDPKERGITAARLAAEASPDGTRLAGELSWWVPELTTARIAGFEIDSTEGVVTWRRYLRVGASIPDDRRWLAAQLSDLTVFDYLINNLDRWTGGNARRDPSRDQLYFMDNTMSFAAVSSRSYRSQRYLERVQRFSRRLVTALRALDEGAVRAALEADAAGLAPLLTEAELAGVMDRRDRILAYVDRLIAAHGEANVLWFE